MGCNWKSNLQPFWCKGWCSNQLSKLAGATILFFFFYSNYSPHIPNILSIEKHRIWLLNPNYLPICLLLSFLSCSFSGLETLCISAIKQDTKSKFSKLEMRKQKTLQIYTSPITILRQIWKNEHSINLNLLGSIIHIKFIFLMKIRWMENGDESIKELVNS